jgi:hypothetical protein
MERLEAIGIRYTEALGRLRMVYLHLMKHFIAGREFLLAQEHM